MAPYLPHCHVRRAAYRDERGRIAHHQQLKPVFESVLLAAAAEILRRKATATGILPRSAIPPPGSASSRSMALSI